METTHIKIGDIEEKLELLQQLLEERENGGFAGVKSEENKMDQWENELLIVEKKLNAKHEETKNDFEDQLQQIEEMMSQRNEENEAYKELNEDLTTKLSQSEMEISNLREIIVGVNRKQALRDLYMKMAYSKIPLKKTLEEAQKDHEKLRNVLGLL